MAEEYVYHFKIGWKFPKCKPMVADYAAPSLRQLLHLLEQSEGVSTATTDYLYIHMILPFGGVKEVLEHDAAKGSLKVDFSPSGKISRGEYPQMESEQHQIVSTVAAALKKAAEEKPSKKQKPRIKLKNKDNKVPTIQSFLYNASEAREG